MNTYDKDNAFMKIKIKKFTLPLPQSINKYILDGHKTIPCNDILKWTKWFEKGNRHVADECIGDMRVSTVFLGIDHSFERGKPLLFETMVFGGDLDGEQERCTTWEQAEVMHSDMVAQVKIAGKKDKGF